MERVKFCAIYESRFRQKSSDEYTPCINCAGGVTMCRRSHLLTYLMVGFGLGLMIGHSLESWLVCTCGGLVFLVLGLGGMWRK